MQTRKDTDTQTCRYTEALTGRHVDTQAHRHVCLYRRIHVCMHVCIRLHVYRKTFRSKQQRLRKNSNIGNLFCVSYLYIYVYVCLHVCLYARTHVTLYVCVHVYILQKAATMIKSSSIDNFLLCLVCMYTWKFTFLPACLHACIYVILYVCVHVCLFAARSNKSARAEASATNCFALCAYI